jgi:1-acyl-sn-glycerol-3-phosphate acyltransferase
MKILKEIAGRIWALWGMVSFVATFLLIYIPAMITWLLPDPQGQRIFINIARLWMSVWLRLVGCPVTIKGREHFKEGTSYVVTCNHNSLLDVPLSSPFIPGPNKTIAKTSFAKVPLFGFYYMKGAILVDRNNDKSRRQSFEKMKEVLAKGIHMCIYPEGTRNRTAEPLKKFYDGAFKLATDTSTSVIPTIIFNTKKALPANKPFYFIPHRLHMHFLPPVPVNSMSAEQLKQTVFGIMKEYYAANNQKLEK